MYNYLTNIPQTNNPNIRNTALSVCCIIASALIICSVWCRWSAQCLYCSSSCMFRLIVPHWPPIGHCRPGLAPDWLALVMDNLNHHYTSHSGYLAIATTSWGNQKQSILFHQPSQLFPDCKLVNYPKLVNPDSRRDNTLHWIRDSLQTEPDKQTLF